jgi:drug/metabolite transporter (DMT)-like permease
VERALPYGIGSVVVGAALLSALLHAAWNAAVRASPDPRSAMAAQVVGSGLLSIPLLMLVPLPSAAALPWLCGSACLNLMMLIALLRGYAHGGGCGFVYPLARATSPLLVLFLASVLQGEAVGPFGIAGIALVSAGIALFAFGEGRQHRRLWPTPSLRVPAPRVTRFATGTARDSRPPSSAMGSRHPS